MPVLRSNCTEKARTKPFPLSRLKGFKGTVEAVLKIYVSVLVFCRPIRAQISKTTHETTHPDQSSEKGG